VSCFSVCDIPDIALDDPPVADKVNVADEFDIDAVPILCLQRYVLVPDISILFQVCERFLGKGFVFEETEFPEVPANKILQRESQQIENEGIRIDNLSALPIKDQDRVLSRLEQPPVPEF